MKDSSALNNLFSLKIFSLIEGITLNYVILAGVQKVMLKGILIFLRCISKIKANILWDSRLHGSRND